MDLESKLIGFRKYGPQPAVPFEGTQGGPYVITVRAGKVLFMRRDRTVEDALGFTKQDVEAMIARGDWGILEKHHPVARNGI